MALVEAARRRPAAHRLRLRLGGCGWIARRQAAKRCGRVVLEASGDAGIASTFSAEAARESIDV